MFWLEMMCDFCQPILFLVIFARRKAVPRTVVVNRIQFNFKIQSNPIQMTPTERSNKTEFFNF